MAAKKSAKKKTARPTQGGKGGFTAEEKAAMREYARERKSTGDGETELLAKVAAMDPADKAMAQRIHAIMKANAPELAPRTWYGMPAYARDGNVVCFFQDAKKFKSRYATLGFSDKAALDDGQMWPAAFALKSIGPADEARIVALVKKALGR
jgi:uncharacterized protein YdhG (YjbR/CyaY superfamily)